MIDLGHKYSNAELSIKLLSKSMVHHTAQNWHTIWPAFVALSERLADLAVECQNDGVDSG